MKCRKETCTRMSKLVKINCSTGSSNVEKNELEFIIRLCCDVLLEVLFFGDRRRLTKFERVGRQFHRNIESFFKQRPFLRICLRIDPSNGIIGLGREKISLTKLTSLPTFIRFDNVRLVYFTGSQPIEKECEFIESYLLRLKSGLNDSNMLEISAHIRHNDCSAFIDHSQLLECIRNRLLPICDSSRGFKFRICFFSDKNSVTSTIASLLQMPEILRCPNVEITIPVRHPREKNQLPVEAISNWLEIANARENVDQKHKERFLKIVFCGIQNAQEMLDHLAIKFGEAKFPVQPFTFRYWRCNTNELGIEAQTLKNKKTGEELSVNILGNVGIEIKRTRKEKERI